MRVIVVGLGIQGEKRKRIAGDEVVACVDPVKPGVDAATVYDVELDAYDAALVCTPDEPKAELLEYFLSNKKHVMVEKPLFFTSESKYLELSQLAEGNGVCCYTAYNHRFEPHFVNLKNLLDTGKLGQIYLVRMFYGNGTARDVRNSVWRDTGSGVLADIGSHLLDTLLFMFGDSIGPFHIVNSRGFENNSPDHVLFTSSSGPTVFQCETTMLSWRNTFRMDVLAEKGSAHIDCLCKWGPSHFVVRERVLPSGRPSEEVETLECSDPTWEAEYEYFKSLCERGESNLHNDIWISKHLSALETEVLS